MSTCTAWSVALVLICNKPGFLASRPYILYKVKFVMTRWCISFDLTKVQVKKHKIGQNRKILNYL